jgi:hypothetical protein
VLRSVNKWAAITLLLFILAQACLPSDRSIENKMTNVDSLFLIVQMLWHKCWGRGFAPLKRETIYGAGELAYLHLNLCLE